MSTNNAKSQGKKRKRVSWPEEPTQKVGNAIETERIKTSCNGYAHWTMFVSQQWSKYKKVLQCVEEKNQKLR